MGVRKLVKGWGGTEGSQAGKGRRQVESRVVVELSILPIVQTGALELILDKGCDSAITNLIVK